MRVQTFISVSYTHLDVYKRQAYKWAGQKWQMVSKVVSVKAEKSKEVICNMI